MTPAESKAAWRKWAKERVEPLSFQQIKSLSTRIVDNLKSSAEFAGARHVLACLSFGKEVHTWGMVDELTNRSSKAVYVPRMDSLGVMHVHPFPCRLRTLRMGLKEPLSTERELSPSAVSGTIDVAIILGLAFERERGYRLGHGKGYFDRFLGEHPVFTIGLSFELLIVDRLPAEEHDVPMKMIVSEQRIYRY